MQRWTLRTRFLLFALACLVPFGVVLGYFRARALLFGADRPPAGPAAGEGERA